MQISTSEPPPYGELSFTVNMSPVSLQSKKVNRDKLRDAIWEITKPLEYIFIGDIQLEIEWHALPKERFESDKSPDVDNIIKPIIDALCGVNGLMIDDCQLQSLCSYWMYNYTGEEKIIFTIKYIDDQWTTKNQLIFIQFDEALCLPLEGYLPKSAITLMISLCKQGFAARQKLAKLGVHDSYTRAILPAYRVFHRTRIKDFPVYKIEEYSP